MRHQPLQPFISTCDIGWSFPAARPPRDRLGVLGINFMLASVLRTQTADTTIIATTSRPAGRLPAAVSHDEHVCSTHERGFHNSTTEGQQQAHASGAFPGPQHGRRPAEKACSTTQGKRCAPRNPESTKEGVMWSDSGPTRSQPCIAATTDVTNEISMSLTC